MGYSAIGPAPAIPAAGAGGELFFEWNGTDTSQFEGSPAYESGLNTGALSVVADVDTPRGNKLRMTAAGTGTGVSIILANDVLPSRRFMVEMDVLDISSQYFGLSFFADDTGAFHGYGFCPGGLAGWHHRVDGVGGLKTGVATHADLVSNGKSGLVTLIIDGDKPVSAQPRFQISGTGVVEAFMAAARFRTDEFAMEPAAASWNSLTANRWGLFLQASGGNAPGTLDLQGLRLFDLG